MLHCLEYKSQCLPYHVERTTRYISDPIIFWIRGYTVCSQKLYQRLVGRGANPRLTGPEAVRSNLLSYRMMKHTLNIDPEVPNINQIK